MASFLRDQTGSMARVRLCVLGILLAGAGGFFDSELVRTRQPGCHTPLFDLDRSFARSYVVEAVVGADGDGVFAGG